MYSFFKSGKNYVVDIVENLQNVGISLAKQVISLAANNPELVTTGMLILLIGSVEARCDEYCLKRCRETSLTPTQCINLCC